MEQKQGLKISIVIPTYQRPLLLHRCLGALHRQDFPRESYEIVVVSDGPDASTGQSLAPFMDKSDLVIRFFSLPQKGGPAAARNLGWQKAQGDLIAFTDDDCLPAPGWLSALWTSSKWISANEFALSGRTVVPLPDVPTDYERNVAGLAAAEFITANCACSKTALLSVGGFDERFRMAWREDSDLQFKFIETGIPILRINDALVIHPVRKAPWGVCIKEERKGVFNALLYKKYPRLYRKKIEPRPPWHYYGIAFFLIILISGGVTGKTFVTVIGLTGWLVLTGWFAFRRLTSTSRAWRHISEMVFTSAVIPLISLFWKFYGSWKYKVLLIP